MPKPKEDPNFDSRAQSRFDALVDDGGDWTWSGLAQAFGRRFSLADLSDLRDQLDGIILERSR